jgi:two-component system NtrC family response regulator
MIVMRRSNVVDESSWPEVAAPAAAGMDPTRERSSLSLHDAEKELILRALEKSGWNKSEASRLLDVPRHVLLYRMKTYGLAGKPKSDRP